MALASDLGEQPSADEQRAAGTVRILAQKVHSHQQGLQLQLSSLLEHKSAVDTADNRLLRLLLADATRTRRRLVRMQAEEQMLAGFAFAKAQELELGDRFLEQASKLCSADG